MHGRLALLMGLPKLLGAPSMPGITLILQVDLDASNCQLK